MYEDRKKAYAEALANLGQAANKRLQNIAVGDNFNPWLAIQQAYYGSQAESSHQPVPYGPTIDPYDETVRQRDIRWEQAVKDAEAIAAGQNRKKLQPFQP